MPWAGTNFTLLYLNLTLYDVVPQRVLSMNLRNPLGRHEGYECMKLHLLCAMLRMTWCLTKHQLYLYLYWIVIIW